MEALTQYGFAGATLAVAVLLLRWLLRTMMANHQQQITQQQANHSTDNRETRAAFIGALEKQQDVFTASLKDERADCAERHREVLGRLDSIETKLDWQAEKQAEQGR